MPLRDQCPPLVSSPYMSGRPGGQLSFNTGCSCYPKFRVCGGQSGQGVQLTHSPGSSGHEPLPPSLRKKLCVRRVLSMLVDVGLISGVMVAEQSYVVPWLYNHHPLDPSTIRRKSDSEWVVKKTNLDYAHRLGGRLTVNPGQPCALLGRKSTAPSACLPTLVIFSTSLNTPYTMAKSGRAKGRRTTPDQSMGFVQGISENTKEERDKERRMVYRDPEENTFPKTPEYL